MNITAACVALLLLVACGSGSHQVSSGDLRSYLAQVEPIRLGVNKLLLDADPVLSAFHDKTMTGDAAGAALGTLEMKFAAATVAIAEVHPPAGELAVLHAAYAHTFVLEDTYLSALVNSFPDGDFGGLPNTHEEQRAAIIQWRTGLQVLADRLHVSLPDDLQQAGRGEIAPSPSGS